MPQINVLALPSFLNYFVQKYFLYFAYQKMLTVVLVQAFWQRQCPAFLIIRTQLDGWAGLICYWTAVDNDIPHLCTFWYLWASTGASLLLQGAKLAEESFKPVWKPLHFFGSSVFLLDQPLNNFLSRCWDCQCCVNEFWNGQQGLLSFVAGCHEISIVVMLDGVLSIALCGLWGFLFYWKVCFPGMSVSWRLARWRVWTRQLWCCRLQDLFSSFCDGRRSPKHWLCGFCLLCAPLLKVTLPSKFSKHTNFSKSSGLPPLDMFCWKTVTSLCVDSVRV